MLATRTPRGYVDMWQLLENTKARPDAPLLFIPTDTHWTDFATGQMAKAIVEAATPGWWHDEAFEHEGQTQHVGDLTRMMGLATRVAIERYDVKRENIAVKPAAASEGHLPGMRIYRLTTRDPSAEATPIDPRRVLLLHDSFMYTGISMIVPFFRETAFSHWQTSSNPHGLAQEIARSQIVVIEVAERGSYNWIHKVFSDAALRTLAATLARS
jgi:hypothetical protein